MKLILASASPRRKDLLNLLGLKFEIQASNIEENCSLKNPQDYVLKLSSEKGESVLGKNRKDEVIVISADTVVALGDKILEKPKDVSEARRMLMALSGRRHTVFTGVWIGRSNSKQRASFACRTDVSFRQIPDDLLEFYISQGDSLDKAGAYGIQSGGLCFVDKVEGCYGNIVGLPLSETDRHLREFLGENYFKLKGPSGE